MFQVLFLAIFATLDRFITGIPVLCPVYAAFTAIPTLLVFIRRLHDCDFSGWWVILAILPPICFFVMSWAPDPFQPNRFGTTERLPRTGEKGDNAPPIIDGVQYLTPVRLNPKGRVQDREDQYLKDLAEIHKQEAKASEKEKNNER